MMRKGVVLFTRDLRTHDHPALAAARRECRELVPLFVLDERLLAVSPRRTTLLLERLDELRRAIGLAVVHGDPVEEVARFDPDRQRMVVAASYLTKELGIDWRIGAAHFMAHLVDGDVASNSGDWQWVAGTGADTRPNRRFSPERQARLHDPDGAYVRRWLSERFANR
jgi:deoxyribodipyrimidine photolyase